MIPSGKTTIKHYYAPETVYFWKRLADKNHFTIQEIKTERERPKTEATLTLKQKELCWCCCCSFCSLSETKPRKQDFKETSRLVRSSTLLYSVVGILLNGVKLLLLLLLVSWKWNERKKTQNGSKEEPKHSSSVVFFWCLNNSFNSQETTIILRKNKIYKTPGEARKLPLSLSTAQSCMTVTDRKLKGENLKYLYSSCFSQSWNSKLITIFTSHPRDEEDFPRKKRGKEASILKVFGEEGISFTTLRLFLRLRILCWELKVRQMRVKSSVDLENCSQPDSFSHPLRSSSPEIDRERKTWKKEKKKKRNDILTKSKVLISVTKVFASSTDEEEEETSCKWCCL